MQDLDSSNISPSLLNALCNIHMSFTLTSFFFHIPINFHRPRRRGRCPLPHRSWRRVSPSWSRRRRQRGEGRGRRRRKGRGGRIWRERRRRK
ncbi:hypothetical protein DAI22_08g075466 [Oryza sativa Japonica Group]|nr:hypothetical protein DAI22_08g075466 [Oryza sativa Japonica Group]